MKLYKSSNRFINEYNFLQSNKAEPLNIFDFSKFDNLHYHGVTAVNFAINKLAINKNDIILDIGSGVGGAARFISYKTGCRVDAIELQSDLSIIGKKFTEILCMSKNVKHINNDFLQKKFRNNYWLGYQKNTGTRDKKRQKKKGWAGVGTCVGLFSGCPVVEYEGRVEVTGSGSEKCTTTIKPKHLREKQTEGKNADGGWRNDDPRCGKGK